ncbi:hypothetical protein Tco_0836717 [Tanacetum coccineum]
MGDENLIRTLGDYSKPSYKGFRNTIELPEGNNVVHLRSDTIQLVQNGRSFHGLWSEDPNQHLEDFLKLVDSLDLDVANIQIFHDHVNPAIRRTIDQSAGGKLHDRNNKESHALLEDLTLYDNESLNDPRDFAKPVKAISLHQDVPSTSDRHLIELENQFQCLMEAYLATKQHVQVNKISSSCEICSGPHDTQYCMENPEQAFVEYASSHARLSKFEADFKQQQSEMTNKIDTVLKAITDRITRALPSDTVKNLKLNVNSTSLVLSAHSYPTEDPQCSNQIHSSINAITKYPKRPAEFQNNKPKEEEHEEKDNLENINTNPSSPPDPSVSFVTEKVCKINSFFESLGMVPQSSNTEFVCMKRDDSDVMFIEIVKKNDDSRKEEPEVGENAEA